MLDDNRFTGPPNTDPLTPLGKIVVVILGLAAIGAVIAWALA